MLRGFARGFKWACGRIQRSIGVDSIIKLLAISSALMPDALSNALYFLRRIKLALEKSKFRQHFLFPIFYFFDPLAILRMALSPFQGACDIPLRQFIKGACNGLREFIQGFE